MPVKTNAEGGGGVGSDECTLLRANVPIGFKAVTADSNDEAVEGTFNPDTTAADSHVLEGQSYIKFNPVTKLFDRRFGARKNNGALNAMLNCNESYTIPAGDTTGGKVTANSLASQTQGTAVETDIMAGKTATVNGVKITGIKVNHGTINATLNCGQSKSLPAGSIDGGTITAASLASQTGGATAEDGYVYSGKTYWRDGVKRTGNMSVNSVLSFSAAAYGGKQILLKWQNPYAAKGKPFSGVEIRYATGGYPGAGGTVIYTGIGSNSAPGGWSQVVITLAAFGTGYYFSLRPYVASSLGTLYGSTLNAYAATQAELWLTFTGSQTYTIPAGYTKMDAFVVGGGGSANYYSSWGRGGSHGGAGGYTEQSNGISVSQGQQLSIVVGAGGGQNAKGSPSIVSRSNITLITAAGGDFAQSRNTQPCGGSGGGESNTEAGWNAGDGGSDGSNGYYEWSSSKGFYSHNKGQGRTTRAWGNGTLFSGGGGGAQRGVSSTASKPGAGGAGGGGTGAASYYSSYGENGAANTGGGAGGVCEGSEPDGIWKTSYGGSGIVLLHIY